MGVGLFSDLICKNWILKTKESYWQVVETAPNANNKEVQIGGCRAIAFSLDRAGENCFPFIATATSKKGMRSVCDAMIVTSRDGRTYFCAMDLKSGISGNATKQIESARRLFDWIIGLAHHHGHWPNANTAGCFFGIVNLAPRNQVRKGLTQRSAEIPAPEKSPYGEYMIFKLKNHPKVSLPLLIARL